MRFHLLWITLILFAACTSEPAGSELSYQEKMLKERARKDSTFLQPNNSPLPTLTAIDSFKGLNYFPIDTKYRVKAVFETLDESEPFKMAATGEQQDIYDKYGKLKFSIDGQEQSLVAYQNLRLKKKEDYEGYLFIPFKDATNGKSTYGGGRYIDYEIPEDDTVLLDFNKAYNPWCVYSHEYSCPIPPEENHLSVAIKAGEKDY